MRETFSNSVREGVVEAQNLYCKRCTSKIHSIHHKLSNTQIYRAKYPLFLQSPFNAVGLCLDCHTNYAHEYRVTEKEAELYESWLGKEFS